MADFFVNKVIAPRTTGAVAQTVYIDIVTAVGAPATALTNATAGILCTYCVAGGNPTAVTLSSLASNTAAWNGSGFIELSAGLMPGKYRLDLPNAAFANTQSAEVVVWKTGTFYGALTIPTKSQTDSTIEVKVDALKTVQDAQGITITSIASGIPFLDVANTSTGKTTH